MSFDKEVKLLSSCMVNVFFPVVLEIGGMHFTYPPTVLTNQ